jgi:hypothetical protein
MNTNDLYKTEPERENIAKKLEAFMAKGGEVKIYNERGVRTGTRKRVNGVEVTTPFVGKEIPATKVTAV